MPPPTKNHYEVLGVPASSSHEEIRRAYHEQARRWHPDRFQEMPAAEAERAELSMRDVNEAWRVLGDQQRRTTYDHSLAGPVRQPRPGVQTSADGVTRIDPRLLDPEFLAARRRSQADDIEYKNSWMLRVLPMAAFIVLIVGIIVFTAYARTPGTAITTTTFRGPDIGIDPGACVRRLPDAGLLALPCDGNEDGVLIAVTLPGATCPEGTKLTQPVKDGMTACLG
ncbi:MAG: J domain-containing protein [Acidimicrobiales bacterium]